MKRTLLLIAVALCLTALAAAQSKQTDLQKVVALLDATSGSFHRVQADFISDDFKKAGDEHENDSGTLYLERSRKGVAVAIDLNAQDPEHHEKVVFKDGIVEIYRFKRKSLETHAAGDNREKFLSFLTLGFGGSGSELIQKFDVKSIRTESVGNTATYRLELTPKSDEVRNMFNPIILWIDQKTGMSVQQKLLKGLTDYRLATYSNFKNALPRDAFKASVSAR